MHPFLMPISAYTAAYWQGRGKEKGEYLVYPSPVNYERICDYKIKRFRRWPIRCLSHAFTNRLAC
jgi:hypothetical protein